MFFLFPFAAVEVIPALRQVTQEAVLPLLPAPGKAHAAQVPADSFGKALSDIAKIAVDALRRALGALTASLTALSSRASAFFSQIAAGLAFERANRKAFAAFNAACTAFGAPLPQPAYAPTSFFDAFSPFPAFGCHGFSMIPWPQNPWLGFCEAADMWTKMWLPSPAPRDAAPFAATFSVPGFSWGFAVR